MTEMTRHMVRMLLLAFCGMMSVLDVFGTSFAKNDLCYIENDAEELPLNKTHLLLILNVVDDVTKVQIGADTFFAWAGSVSVGRRAHKPVPCPRS